MAPTLRSKSCRPAVGAVEAAGGAPADGPKPNSQTLMSIGEFPAGQQAVLLELLEVPQLMDTCVRDGNCNDALDLRARGQAGLHARRPGRRVWPRGRGGRRQPGAPTTPNRSVSSLHLDLLIRMASGMVCCLSAVLHCPDTAIPRCKRLQSVLGLLVA